MKTLAKAIAINRRFTSRAMTEASQGIAGTAFGRRGFTLVELIVVCAILGVLVAMAIPSFDMIADRAKEARCIGEIRGIVTDIGANLAEKGALPAILDDIGRGGLKDPWGNIYEYDPVPKYKDISGIDNTNTDYDLYSIGKDGFSTKMMSDDISKPGSQDDVVRASDGNYLGRVSSFNP